MTQPSHQDKDWFVQASGAGLERFEAYFQGHAYEPHRHDTYAIGITLSGVQSFRYRGALCRSTPGTAIVLHPDETHDGHAGSSAGFRYRMLYVPPMRIQDILGGQPLPFIASGLSRDPRLIAVTQRLLSDISGAREPLEDDDALYELTRALQHHAEQRDTRKRVDYPAAGRAREYLDSAIGTRVCLADLERASGQSRWRLSRDFRAVFGTSPYRYLTLRRLDAAKDGLRRGQPLTETAYRLGFADQSHLSRQFARAFGLSPGRWIRLVDCRKSPGGLD